VPYLKAHDLADLWSLVPIDEQLDIAEAELKRLNPWTIEGRYPGDIPDATRAQADGCIQAAERVVHAVHSAIGDLGSAR